MFKTNCDFLLNVQQTILIGKLTINPNVFQTKTKTLRAVTVRNPTWLGEGCGEARRNS